MSSTNLKKSSPAFLFASELISLLRERGKTQKDLADETGLTPARINRIAKQRNVHTIVTSTAGKICIALSRWPRVRDRKAVTVRLDALFPMKLSRVI
jgi:DNA-binding Xre family transcriptional regulator